MAKELQIPQDLQESFAKLMDLIPAAFKNDQQIQKDLLLFLKLEGEDFVREKIEKTIKSYR